MPLGTIAGALTCRFSKAVKGMITGVNLERGIKIPTRVLFVKGENSNYIPENSEVRLTDYYRVAVGNH
jgi:hypothetical protein